MWLLTHLALEWVDYTVRHVLYPEANVPVPPQARKPRGVRIRGMSLVWFVRCITVHARASVCPIAPHPSIHLTCNLTVTCGRRGTHSSYLIRLPSEPGTSFSKW